MERCDFSAIMGVIRTYTSQDRVQNQVDFLYMLFAGFMEADENADFDFDNALVCRWMNGTARVSPRITSYYLEPGHRQRLAADIAHNVLPLMYDSAKAMEALYELVICDADISDRQKQRLTENYPCSDNKDEAFFLTHLLCFAMERSFVKRDTGTRQLLAVGGLSPMVMDFIVGAEVPKPCRYFCGRENELEALHTALKDKGKVFLSGISGIGKSELAKAYAKAYKKEYTNILYLTYSGDLKQDITDLDFLDDLPSDKEVDRFRKHNRFLRTLKADTLLIVDNFNARATQDAFLPVVLNYRCRILFTTRSHLEHYANLELSEISDSAALLNLMTNFFPEAEQHRETLEQMIETVHAHTLAVELAARLLGKGLLSPEELLRKLQLEHAALDTADKIGITKDGKASKETYYGHIHTLFALYLLSESQQNLMRSLSLFPVTGISVRRTVDWLNLCDLNDLEDLIEAGFVTPDAGHIIRLHPMMQEIAIADLKPSVMKCSVLLTHLQQTCLAHGIDVSYFKQMFQTIENTIAYIDNDAPAFYLRFLEDVFPYMEKYRYRTGMDQVVSALALEVADYGTNEDQALLLDYRAALAENPQKAIKYELDAIALIPEVNAENALLVSNLHSNLGGLYAKVQQNTKAIEHTGIGIQILQQYQPPPQHDWIAKICNYAMLLNDNKQPEQGFSTLQTLEDALVQNGLSHTNDHMMVLEAMGGICLGQGRIREGTSYMRRAFEIYEELCGGDTDMLEAKQLELARTYAVSGLNIASKLSTKKE